LKVRRFISAVWGFMTPERHDLAMLIIVAIIGLEMAILLLFVYWAFLLFAPVMAIFTAIAYACYLWRGRSGQ
jgi:hypothetical protein